MIPSLIHVSHHAGPGLVGRSASCESLLVMTTRYGALKAHIEKTLATGANVAAAKGNTVNEIYQRLGATSAIC